MLVLSIFKLLRVIILYNIHFWMLYRTVESLVRLAEEMSKHKKQHYIPKSYLKTWCDPNTPKSQTPYVWRLKNDGSDSSKKSPDNIFYESDMYTIITEDGQRDLTLEHGLCELEGQFSTIRRKKLEKRKPLTETEHLYVCAFAAALHSRTKSSRDHWKSNWEMPLKRMEELLEWGRTATREDKIRASASNAKSAYGNNSLSYDEVKELYEKPLQTMLPSMVSTLTNRFQKMQMAILCTEIKPGFISSDSPCFLYDPEAHKRPPLQKVPGLKYPTTEVYLPISPKQTLLLTNYNYVGYHDKTEADVDEINRLIVSHSYEYFVANTNVYDDFWFVIDDKNMPNKRVNTDSLKLAGHPTR